jgi:hypothetical protein
MKSSQDWANPRAIRFTKAQYALILKTSVRLNVDFCLLVRICVEAAHLETLELSTPHDQIQAHIQKLLKADAAAKNGTATLRFPERAPAPVKPAAVPTLRRKGGVAA